jgi:hypothetical protein
VAALKNRLGVAEWILEAFGSWEARFRGHAPARHRHTQTTSVFCFGESHTISLRRAWKRGLYRPGDPSLHFSFRIADNKHIRANRILVHSPATGEKTIGPELEQAFHECTDRPGSSEAWFVSTVGGNVYNIYGLFEPDPPFDFVHPELPTLPVRKDAQLVPYGAVKAIFSRAAERTRRFYRCLPRLNVAGIVHVEAPPPIADEEQCRRSIDQRVMKKALKLPKDVRISSPEFRLKLWMCQSDVHRDICREQGVIYVAPPAEALDAQGYLVPAGWHGATHASAWYGSLTLKKVEGMILERKRAVAMADAADRQIRTV